MKIIAEAKKPICLMEPRTRDIVSDDRPRVVSWTQFIETRCGKGEINVIETGLPDSASDEEFQGYLTEASSGEQAIAAYMSYLNGDTPDQDREALERKARELGINFGSSISNKKLAERIAAAKG